MSILAAGDAPEFLAPVAAIIVTAAAVAWISQRLGLVPIVGFLVAGVVIGPNALGLVARESTVEAAADVGVILLLFVIGIEFNLERLARERRMLLGGGLATVAAATLGTMGVVLAFGVDVRSATYTGLLVSVSSTAVVLALLASRHRTTTEGGRTSVAILIFEDLAVIAMVLVIPMLGTEGGSPLDIARALGTAALVIAAIVVGARKVMPRVIEAVARACSTEVFLLAILAVCFAVGYVTYLAGVGVSLGAFLAGLLVSESRFSAHALGEILPLEIVFTATFFMSVGMLLDPSFLVDEWLLVLASVVGVLVIKALTGTVAAVVFGVALPVALGSAVLRAQIGEFSFVLEGAGREAGLSPLGLDERGVQVFLATSVLLMVITPVLSPVVDGALERRQRASARARPAPAVPGPAAGGDAHVGSNGDGHGVDLRDHVVVAGFGDAARHLVPALAQRGVPLVVTTLNPGGAVEAEAMGVPVLRGDAAKQQLLERAGVRRAALVVIPDDEPEQAARIATVARSLGPDVPVVVASHAVEHLDDLAAAGVSGLVAAERAGRDALLAEVGRHMGVQGRGGRPVTELVAFRPDPGTPCDHLGDVRAVLPGTAGCEECLAAGHRWVHLRICLSCGHVGCCDDSPNRHARVHFEGTGHAVMASFEPGERWAWCFADEVDVAPAPDLPPAVVPER